MPVHFIPFECESIRPLVWYQSLGLIGCNQSLYCVSVLENDEEQLALIVSEKLSVKHLPTSPSNTLWPNSNFFINIQYGTYIPLLINVEHRFIMPLFLLMCQERFKGVFRYVDEINTALKTLQRWIRTTLRRRNQIAVAMAIHSRLGFVSGLAVVGLDLIDSIISRL